MRRIFALKEAFYSIQGEGFWCGAPSVFLRFAGCNANCAFCDTDFAGVNGPHGGMHTAEALLELVRQLWPDDSTARVILTGGEPSLQITPALLDTLHDGRCTVHVESNGSIKLPAGERGPVDWLTVSPKALRLAEQPINEVKVVVPAFDPLAYEHLAPVRYVQPEWGSPSALRSAIDFVLAHPSWKLSLQTHKLAGVP